MMRQSLFLAAVVTAAWLSMQQVHELGHVLGAGVTGGKVMRVVLAPQTISRTDLAANPRPLVAVWAGPLFGVVAPLIVWGVLVWFRCKLAFLARFFAGFCLIANGAYIGGGAAAEIGDCGEMLRHGSPIWTLWLFGAVTVPVGLSLWNGLEADFGLGKSPKPEIRGVVVAAVVWLAVALLISFLFPDTTP